MKKAEYMEDHIGEVYDGVISGVCDFGIFVMLDNTVEGLVRIEDIPNDNYFYNKELNLITGRKTKNRYMYGDKICVKVVKANRETSQVDFVIV